jgi:hypothetical protein
MMQDYINIEINCDLTIAKWNSSIALLTYVGLSWKYKFHATSEKAQHAFKRVILYFWGWWGGEGFFSSFFFPVSNVFPSSSQGVAQKFPKMFPVAHQFYPICFGHSSTSMDINFKGELGDGFVLYGREQGVCHNVALPSTLKSISRQKKKYGNSNISP